MNDLDVLRDFAPDAPLLSSAELSEARHRVATGISRKRPGRARRIVIGGVTVAAAGAIAAGVLAGQNRPAVVAIPTQLTAREVLEHAATAALEKAAVVPQADQFVYSKVSGGPGTAVVQTWLSVDGTRNGLVITTEPDGKRSSSVQLGCMNGSRTYRLPGRDGKPLKLGSKPVTFEQYKQKYGTSVPMDGPLVTTACTAQRAYFPDMPTRTDAMGPWLARTQGIRLNDLNDLAKTVGYMLESDYILPAQHAALYRFLATTPGLVLEPHVRDVSGRPGIGVGWSFEGSKAVNIFAAGSYAYLGATTWGEQGQQGGDALVRTAVTDRAGEVP
jgi:hypothetical protein